MKRTAALLTLAMLIAFTCNSCFEIRETVRINKDGSGTFTMSIDLSQVKAMLEGLGGGDDAEGGSPFADMEKEFESTRKLLEEINGISNIQFVSKNDGYVVSTSFDFASLDALNEGIGIVYEQEDPALASSDFYIMKKRSFERTESHDFLDMVKNELAADEMGVEGMDLAQLFSEVTYVNEIFFEGQNVRKVKSGKAVINSNGNGVKNTFYIFKDSEEQSLEYKLRIK